MTARVCPIHPPPRDTGGCDPTELKEAISDLENRLGQRMARATEAFGLMMKCASLVKTFDVALANALTQRAFAMGLREGVVEEIELKTSCCPSRVQSPQVDVEVVSSCCNIDKRDIREEIAKTSGEAKNPGPPNVTAKKVKQVIKKAVAKSKANAPSGFRLKGKGDYVEDIAANLGGKLGGFIGDKLGNESLGSNVGSFLAKKGLSLFKNLFGMGDYVLSDTPAVNSLVAGSSPPVIDNDFKNRAFVFKHREFVANVLSSDVFANNSYALNPGMSTPFTWLGPIASLFEEWRPMGIIAEYKSLVSPLGTNSSGSVVFATEYNPTKANFVSKVQAENSEFATSCRPMDSMLHAIECAPSETPISVLQVRTGAVPSGQDQRFYDLGNLQLICQGQTSAGTVIGEFWLSYEIALMKPLYNTTLGLTLLSDKWALSGITSASPLGATPSKVNYSTSVLGSSISAGNKISLPSWVSGGEFLVVYNTTSASGSTTTLPTITCVNCTVKAFWVAYGGGAADGVSVAGLAAGAAAAQQLYCWIVTTNSTNGSECTMTISTMTLTGASTGDLIISQLNGNISA